MFFFVCLCPSSVRNKLKLEVSAGVIRFSCLSPDFATMLSCQQARIVTKLHYTTAPASFFFSLHSYCVAYFQRQLCTFCTSGLPKCLHHCKLFICTLRSPCIWHRFANRESDSSQKKGALAFPWISTCLSGGGGTKRCNTYFADTVITMWSMHLVCLQCPNGLRGPLEANSNKILDRI